MVATSAQGGHLWPLWHASRHSLRTVRSGSAGDARPMLERHERFLAGRTLPTGGRVIGTDRGLILVGRESSCRRITWADIAEAEWARGAGLMVVRLWPDASETPTCLEVPTDRRFAEFASEQVRWSQLMRRRVWLTATVSATVVATRTPGADTVTWRVRLDAGCIGDDPTVALAAQRAVADLRSLAGC